MAIQQFTIGQRVRITAPGNLHGCQGTIYDIRPQQSLWMRMLEGKGMTWADDAISAGVHPKETAYLLDVDGLGRRPMSGGVWGFPSYWLLPLQDPKAGEFIERMKKIAREPINLPKVPALDPCAYDGLYGNESEGPGFGSEFDGEPR